MKINNNKQNVQPLPDKDLQQSFRYSMFICTNTMLENLMPEQQEDDEEES